MLYYLFVSKICDYFSDMFFYRIKDILPQLKAEHNPDAKEIAEKEADVITKYNEISPYISRTNVSVKVEDYSNVFTKVMEEKNITYGEIEPVKAMIC